jgi:ribose 5-phosphate isomerase A
MTAIEWKRAAAAKALEFVEPSMKVGLGTGSTAAEFVALLAAKVKDGLDVVCVPTSEATATQARAAGLALTTLDAEPILDLTVDGADEFDGELRLIKGGGGALLREKIVATSSDRLIIIADHTKKVAKLGAFPLPVEAVRFGLGSTRRMIEALAGDIGCEGEIVLRLAKDGQVFLTDGGNVILDCAFGPLGDPEALDDVLRHIPGVVENGLFLGICDTAIIAGPDGVQVIEANVFGDWDEEQGA